MEINKQTKLKRIQLGSLFQGREAEKLRKLNGENNMKRHLIALVSTDGKTKGEVLDEVIKAYEKLEGEHNRPLEKINKEIEEEIESEIVFMPKYGKQ